MSLDCHEELPYEQDLLFCQEKPFHEPMQLSKNGLFLKENDTCRDARILKNLLQLTETYRSQLQNYMVMNKQDVDSESHYLVTEWMRDVFREVYRGDQLTMTAQAIHVMNQFLGVGPRLSPSNLQGLAASCLLLVSKANNTVPIPIRTAANYTNDAFSAEDLKNFEKLILCKCKFDMSPATRAEIVDPLVHEINKRWHSFTSLSEETKKTFQLETEYFLTLSLFQYQLNFEKSSVLVAGCMMLAFNKMLHQGHLLYHYTDCFLEEVLRQIIGSEDGEIEECARKLRGCLKEGRNQEPPFLRRFSVASPTPDHLAPSTTRPAQQQPSQHLAGQNQLYPSAAARQGSLSPSKPSLTIDLTGGETWNESDQEINRASQEVEAAVLLAQGSPNIYFNSFN